MNRFLLQKDAAQQLVFYWYHSQGRAIAGELAARVEFTSPIYGSVSETSERLVSYVQAMYPILTEYLPD